MTETVHDTSSDESRQRPDSDETLLRRYRDAGDTDAFDELVHRYEGELYRYLRRYLNDPALAEDVFQLTFLKLHRKSHLFQEGRRVRPWLYSIATHQAIDALRKSGRQPTASLDDPRGDEQGESDVSQLLALVEAETPSPVLQAEEAERRDWIRQAVGELPDHLRVVVVMIFFQGLKYNEVAESLEIPLGTVKSRLHTALTKLAEAWKRSSQP